MFASEEIIEAYAQRLQSSFSSSSPRIDGSNNEMAGHVISFECHPKPITPQWLHERMNEDLSESQSRSFVNLLHNKKFIDPASNMLLVDPRRYWKNEILPLVKQQEERFSDLAVLGLEECINLADGTHELTSEHIEDVYEFWVGGR